MALFLLGVLIGGIIAAIAARILVIQKADGYFIVDDDDADTQRWTLDMHIDQEEVPKKKWLRLRIVIKQ